MHAKSKTRFMKLIVWICIMFTALVITGSYVAAWFGVNTDSILTHTCAVFGGELLLTVILKLLEKGDEQANQNEENA